MDRVGYRLNMPPSPPDRRPNIRIRPDRRIGRVQRQIRRLLIIRGQMNTVELAGSIYGRPTKSWHRWNVRRAAPKVAVHVRRVRGGWLWKLK
jgi:hypothetical protein